MLTRRSLESVVLLQPDRANEPFAVNGAGTAVWELLAEPTTPDLLLEALAAQFGESDLTIRTVVMELLNVLLERGAVQRL